MRYRCLYIFPVFLFISNIALAQKFPPSQAENFNASEFILAGKVTQTYTFFRDEQGAGGQKSAVDKKIEITSIRFQIDDNLEDDNFQPGQIIDIEFTHKDTKEENSYSQIKDLELYADIVIGLSPSLTDNNGEVLMYAINTPNVINTYGNLDLFKAWIDKVRHAEPLELNEMIKKEWEDKGVDEKYAALLDKQYENSLDYEFVETPNSDTDYSVGEESSESTVNTRKFIDPPVRDTATPSKSMIIKTDNKPEEVVTKSLIKPSQSSPKTEESNSHLYKKLLSVGVLILVLIFLANRKFRFFT